MARDGPESHHGKRGERAHGAGIVISGDAGDRGVELGGDVEVGEVGGKAGASGIVELEDGEEGLFVADVEEP